MTSRSRSPTGTPSPSRPASRTVSRTRRGRRYSQTPQKAQPKKARPGSREAAAEATAKNKDLFLKIFGNMGTILAAAKACKIARRTHYRWLEEDDDYAERFGAAQQDAADQLEAEARRRAFNGSDVLLIFLLKGARPEKYRERYEHQVTGKEGGPVTFTLKLHRQELDGDPGA